MLASLPAAQREKALRQAARASKLRPEVVAEIVLRDWRVVGRPKQQPPAGEWTYWWLRAGRGFGKTLSAAQWTRDRALEHPGCRIALVAPTIAAARDTQVEGETGLLSILRPNELRGGSRDRAWNRSLGELHLANGTQFKTFTSEKPGQIRGPQHHYAWLEEVSHWRDAHLGAKEDTTWSNAQLSTRLGDFPQFCLTSTPKPNRLTKHLAGLAAPTMRMVVGSSYENRANLSEAWWRQVVAPLEGTRTGLQEIEAMILDDVPGALWTHGTLDERRAAAAPDLAVVLVGVDPNASSDEAANEAGIVVAGRGRDRQGYVLADRTPDYGGPAVWAQAAVDAYREFEADAIVAEKNQGGEMVAMVLKAVDPGVPVRLVSASRGKRTRAEPVAALYTGSRAKDGAVVVPPSVWHVGPANAFPELEEQMCTWTPDADSPDRMDALVWALTELMLVEQGGIAEALSPAGYEIPAGPARR